MDRGIMHSQGGAFDFPQFQSIYDPTDRSRLPQHRLPLLTDILLIRLKHGISVADHIGRSVRETVPDVADQVECIVETVLRTGKPSCRN